VPRSKTERIKDTVIPNSFKRFYNGMKKRFDLSNKKTVTNVVAEDGRKIATVIGLASTSEHLMVVLNKSREWLIPESSQYDDVKMITYKTGDIALMIKPRKYSQKQARQIVVVWAEAQLNHVPKHTVNGKERVRGLDKTWGKNEQNVVQNPPVNKIKTILRRKKRPVSESAASVAIDGLGSF